MNARSRDDSTESGTALGAEGPLRRWARRRREVAREEQALAEARQGDAPEGGVEIPESVDEASAPAGVEESVLTDVDMPPLESLGENSDYSGFLSPGVSEGLRRRALRKLFTSAVFNVPDGLDDYDDDFTSFAALGDIVTADMRHQAEVEAERARQAEAGTEPATGSRDASEAVEGDHVAALDEDTAGHAGETAGAEAASSDPVSLAESDRIQGRATEHSPEDADADDRVPSDSEPESAPGVASIGGADRERT